MVKSLIKSLNDTYPASFFEGGTAFVDLTQKDLVVMEYDQEYGTHRVYDVITGSLYNLGITDYSSFIMVGLVRPEFPYEMVA